MAARAAAAAIQPGTAVCIRCFPRTADTADRVPRPLETAETLGKDGPETLAQGLEAMDQESERRERTIVQLLTLARTGHTEMNKEPVNLSGIVKTVIIQLLLEGNVAVTVELDEKVTVMGDVEQLRQVVVILLENAYRYTEEGSITVSLMEDDSNVQLGVLDTGIGIAEEEQEKVFDRFYRVDKACSRVSGGTDLGLLMPV